MIRNVKKGEAQLRNLFVLQSSLQIPRVKISDSIGHMVRKLERISVSSTILFQYFEQITFQEGTPLLFANRALLVRVRVALPCLGSYNVRGGRDNKI